MQNYIEKKHASPYFIFFFLRKTNQESRKSIFNVYFYKTYQRHNLLSETEQMSLDLRSFWFVLLENFDHSKPHKWLYVFFYLFFVANFHHTIINLVSDFTSFLLFSSLFFFNGHGLTCSILLRSGSFAPKFWEMIKIQF